MKKTFVFYNDRQDYTEEMSLEEKGLFLQVILDYQNWKEIVDIWPIKFIWSRVKKQLDEDNKKRAEEIEKRRIAGIEWNKKRWWDRKSSQVIASATKSSQVIADNVNVNDTVNVNDNDNKKDITKEETTPSGVSWKKKSIINKHNKPWAIEIYDKIKEMCVVVDWTLDDCVVLRSKLEKYWTDPVNLLDIMITKMRDTWLNKYYSVSNPWKLAEHIGTIVDKLKSEKPKKTLKVF